MARGKSGIADWKGRIAAAILLAAWPMAAIAQSQEPAKPAEKPQEQPMATAPTIHMESRIVLVDAVVTDKKGNYLQDLSKDDFKVYEDNKEQTITSFAFGSDPASPVGTQKRYLVLFFDNSSMAAPDQIQARAAAAKFVEKSAGNGNLMAVVDFGGTLRIRQNFTADADLLAKAVGSVQFAQVASNEPSSQISPSAAGAPGFSSLSRSEADYGARTMLLAIRSLAKNLRSVPGRKMLILFSAGFPTDDPERISELTATIDACNKANVSIYPLDVRGLKAPGSSRLLDEVSGPKLAAANGNSHSRQTGRARLVLASYSPAEAAEPQKPGGGGGGAPSSGGGGRTGGPVGTAGGSGGRGGAPGAGGAAGGRSGAPGGTGAGAGAGGTRGGYPRGGTGTPVATRPMYSPYSNYYNNPNNSPRSILPPLPDSTATNQQVLLALAEGTGGFAIINTNDLLGGLDKIAREQNEFYLLGYVPPESADGSCHTIKVKMEHGGMHVRSRSGYCNVRPTNPLDGKPIEKQLEQQASGSKPGTIQGSLKAPFFYSAPNVAQINLALEIPGESVNFEKDKGKYHATVNVLGMAYNPDGSVGARFNDTLDFDLEKGEWKDFTKHPYQYQNQFDAAPGNYKLSVVLSSGGDDFAKFETPLHIEPYDGQKFTLGGLVLSNTLEPVDQISTDMDATMLEDRTPLVIKGMQITPAAKYSFKKSDKVVIYSQVYEPLLASSTPPRVAAGYSILDSSNKQVFFTGAIPLDEFIEKGNAVVPFGMIVETKNLAPGDYRLVLQAIDGAHNQAAPREAAFSISN